MLFPPTPPRPRKPLDSHGAGDRAGPSHVGQLPPVEAPGPFSTREHARLLVLRGCIRAGLVGTDDVGCVEGVSPVGDPWARCVHAYAPAHRGWSDAIVVGAPVLAGTVLAMLGHVVLTAHLPGL